MQDPQSLPELVNNDAWLVYRGRYIDTTFLLEIGEKSWLISIFEGAVKSVQSGPFVMPRWAFAVRVQQSAWEEYCRPVPKPGYHDIMALVKFKRATLEGDQQPLMANLLYFKDLLAKFREKKS